MYTKPTKAFILTSHHSTLKCKAPIKRSKMENMNQIQHHMYIGIRKS